MSGHATFERPCQDPRGLVPLVGGVAGDSFGLVLTILEGKYRVEAVEAAGGASIVYRANHLPWDRPVAVKVFNPTSHLTEAQTRQFFEPFVREGALSAELSACSLAVRQALGFGSSVTSIGQRVDYLVLEWLDGEPLDLQLAARRAAGLGPLSLEAAMDLLAPVAEALSVAHDKGICHRDVKPGNIFVLSDESARCRVKLIDFGAAREFAHAGSGDAEASAFRSFTPAYGAPEQFEPCLGPTGPWTDVFAFALVLVELMTGPVSPEGATPEDDARVALDARARPTPRARGARVPDRVERVFRNALTVDPMNRMATIGSFWRALESAADDELSSPLPLCNPPVPRPGARGRAAVRSSGVSRLRATAVRALAACVIFAALALEAVCVAKQMGWQVSFDPARAARRLVDAGQRMASTL